MRVVQGLIPAHAGKTPPASMGMLEWRGLIPAHAGKTSARHALST